MKCSRCAYEDSKVLESRLSQDGRSTRRRRSCRRCDHRYTTYEREEEPSIYVKKKALHVERYSRAKALRSIEIACQKRPIPGEAMERILQNIEGLLQEKGQRSISSRQLGDHIMRALGQLDAVAYVRFASVYKEFQTPREFQEILDSLEGQAT